MSKSKHHEFRSIRGSAALAALFFNYGRNVLVDFFKQHDMDINIILFKHLLPTDNRRIQKSNKNKEQRSIELERKAANRRKAMQQQLNTEDYDAGGFGF